jgi:rare lipoprotein A
MNKSSLLPRTLLIATLMTLASCSSKMVNPAPVETAQTTKDGGYYLDDGPGANAPDNIDAIPDAIPQPETYSTRANKPYVALKQKYTPMTRYEPYEKQGTASWYGKRYHGKKTSIGETYDMYGMTAAHPTLPIPSYAKVTNAANGKSVVVRINDRGPFIDNRLIDLSYAAAHKLRMVEQGSATVTVKAIDNSVEALQAGQAPVVAESEVLTTAEYSPQPVTAVPVAEPYNAPATYETGEAVLEPYDFGDESATTTVTQSDMPPPADLEPYDFGDQTSTSAPVTYETVAAPSANAIGQGFFLQVGAFQSEANGNKLLNKVSGFDSDKGVEGYNLFNAGIYRVKLGPYATRNDAEIAAAKVRQQYNIKAIIKDSI